MDGESLRRAAQYRLGGDHDDPDDREREDADARARDRRMEAQPLWIDQQIRAAIARGEFDGLPYAGRPLPEQLVHADRDWWLKRLVEREQITGVLPPALQLRKDDTELDDRLDRLGSERQVRELLEEFNRRVIEARRQLLGGPPVVTPLRDVDAEIAAWRQRAAERRERAERRRAAEASQRPRRRSWFRRR